MLAHFPSPGGVGGALTSKQTQAIECNELCDEVRVRVKVSGGERRGIRKDLGAWASRGSRNWLDKV